MTRAFSPEAVDVRWHRLTGAMCAIGSCLLDLIASRSYAVTLRASVRAQLLDKVSKLLDSHPDLKERSEIVMSYRTRCTRVRRG